MQPANSALARLNPSELPLLGERVDWYCYQRLHHRANLRVNELVVAKTLNLGFRCLTGRRDGTHWVDAFHRLG